MNIFQEMAIASWFLMKVAVFSLTVIGAGVVWGKYGHLTKPIYQRLEKRVNGVYYGGELDPDEDY